MYKIRPQELINSKAFVREPVDKEVNDILSSEDKRIIVTGGRGVGKSAVLYSLENRGLGTTEQTICLFPDAVITMGKEPGERFNEEAFDTFNELYLSRQIIYYIKDNYPILFSKYFKEDGENILKLTHEFDDILNDSAYDFLPGAVRFKTELYPGELSKGLLEKFRDVKEIEKLNVAINRFDHMNGSSKYVQKIFKNYFRLFDKAIITSDDPNLNKEELKNKGYSIKEISYGNDKEVLREIIKRRIELMKKEKKDVPSEIFTHDYFLDKVLDLAGNISLVLEIINYTNIEMNFDRGINLGSKIDYIKKTRVEENKKLEKIISKSTLYL